MIFEQIMEGHTDDRIEKLVDFAAEDQCKRLFHGSLLAPPSLLKDHHDAPDITGESGVPVLWGRTLSKGKVVFCV